MKPNGIIPCAMQQITYGTTGAACFCIGSRRLICTAFSAAMVLNSLSCIPIGPSFLRVEGELIHADSGEPFLSSDGTVWVRALSGGGPEELGIGTGFLGFDGSFLAFVAILGESPKARQLELIVMREDCEQRFLLEVNENTVVDLSFPNRTLELKNPILVPPCEEPANGE